MDQSLNRSDLIWPQVACCAGTIASLSVKTPHSEILPVSKRALSDIRSWKHPPFRKLSNTASGSAVVFPWYHPVGRLNSDEPQAGARPRIDSEPSLM